MSIGTEQSTQLLVSRKILAKLVKQFDFNRKLLDENQLKELKRILKNNPDVIELLFTDFLKHLRQNNCEHRLAVLLLCDELFKRSHIFRIQLISNLQDFLVLTAETDPVHYPLPSPKEAAEILKVETLKIVKLWHEKFAQAYPKLEFAVKFLRSSKSFDFENVSARLQIERQRAEEEERRKEEKSKLVVQKVNTELRERKDDILRCINETRHAIELLVPRFEVDDSTTTKQPTNIRDEGIHGYDDANSIAVIVPLNGPVVNMSTENDIIISSLVDCMRMLEFFEKIVNRWLFKLTQYGDRNAQEVCKELIDLKSKIAVELERCKELHLPNKKKTSDDDSESDDFEDVPEKEGLELNFKPPEELPAYILRKTIENEGEKLPNCSKINQLQRLGKMPKDIEQHEDSGNNIPVLSFGLDLKYWGEDDIEPAEVPRNNSDCHRFWRPSDESCSTSRDNIEVYHSRVMTFVGSELKSNRQCRTPLKDGTLCPRMDLKRCPLHGKIIDRDEMGYPLEEIKQGLSHLTGNTKEDIEYIKDVEAAVGINLRGNNGVRKRKNELDSNRPAAVRERLSTKLFKKNTIKRVYETLESIRKERAARNFEHQFNYALTRR